MSKIRPIDINAMTSECARDIYNRNCEAIAADPYYFLSAEAVEVTKKIADYYGLKSWEEVVDKVIRPSLRDDKPPAGYFEALN